MLSPGGKVYQVSVFNACEALCRNADKSTFGYNTAIYVYRIFIAVLVLVPYVKVFAEGRTVDFADPAMYFLLISASVLTMVFGNVTMIFLYAGVFDAFRQHAMLEMLNKMIRVSDVDADERLSFSHRPMEDAMMMQHSQHKLDSIWKLTDKATVCSMNTQRACTEHEVIIGELHAEANSRAQVPRIDFFCPTNVLCWTYCRMVVQNFGERFRFRIDLNVALFALLTLALIAIGISYSYITAAGAKAYESCYFIQSCILVTVSILTITLVCHAGAKVNEALELHK